MGMRDFKTDKNKLNEGIWIELPPNKDGTIPRIKARAVGDFNPEYAKIAAQKVKKVSKILAFEGAASDKERDRIYKEMMVEYAFVDWENMQPNDDGVVLEFNAANVRNIVFDDEWKPLVSYVTLQCSSYERYNQDNLETLAGN